MFEIYDDHGISFRYPAAWEAQVDDDDARTTVTLTAPGGTAFAMVTIDADRPDAGEMAEQALDAMREEYPELEATPAGESIAGYDAVGHDLEFFSLDFGVACQVRCYRTPRHTVMVLGQWADTGDAPAGEDDDEPEPVAEEFAAQVARLRKSLEETAEHGDE